MNLQMLAGFLSLANNLILHAASIKAPGADKKAVVSSLLTNVAQSVGAMNPKYADAAVMAAQLAIANIDAIRAVHKVAEQEPEIASASTASGD